MAANTAYVTAGKPAIAGGIYYGATGSTLPTDSTTAIDTTVYTLLGYIGEDGVVNSNSPESSTVRAWGGYDVLTLQTGRADTFQFTLLEALNEDVLKVVYGSSAVTGALNTGLTVNVAPGALTDYVYIIDMVVTDSGTKRIVIPNGQVQSIGDITYSDGGAVGYQVTINAAPDSSGKTHYEYIKQA